MQLKPTAVAAGIAVILGMAAVMPEICVADIAAPLATPPLATGLLGSSVPKTVSLDPATGAIVTESFGVPALPYISSHGGCATGDGCYYGKPPYSNQGFSGSPGTASGNWPERTAWDTGDYTAYACWKSACSQAAFGPNTYVTFNGSTVTGTSFTIK